MWQVSSHQIWCKAYLNTDGSDEQRIRASRQSFRCSHTHGIEVN